jgi:hypothetical protein
VVCGVAFSLPVGQVSAREHEMWARAFWSAAAVFRCRASTSTYHRAVAAESVFDGNHGQVDVISDAALLPNSVAATGVINTFPGVSMPGPAVHTWCRCRTTLSSL